MDVALDQLDGIADDALMILYSNGDQEAARELARRHTPNILGLAFRMLRDADEAQDVAQEAMLRLWKIAPDWRAGEAKVSTWLYRVASNLCTDRLRRARGTDLEDAPEQVDEAKSAETQIMDEARASKLKWALGQLPERQRMAVSLRHLEEMTNPEIAEIMDLSVEAVESLTSRAKRKLKEILQGQKAEIGYDT